MRPSRSCATGWRCRSPTSTPTATPGRPGERGVYIQTGTFLEVDARWPGVVFNTTCLIGPDGLLSRYRKVNPWLPWEVHASPHDLPGYDEPLFPVVETEIGRLGAAICYDWLFPEAIRALALGGAEVLIRVSAYMDPWGATPPLDWWTLFNRARAVENFAYVVAANQGASAANYPPFSWPGGSMIVDFDGRISGAGRPRAGREDRRRRRSTWPRSAPSEGGGGAIISFPTCGPKPILTSTPGPSSAPAGAIEQIRHPRDPARPAYVRIPICLRGGTMRLRSVVSGTIDLATSPCSASCSPWDRSLAVRRPSRDDDGRPPTSADRSRPVAQVP